MILVYSEESARDVLLASGFDDQDIEKMLHYLGKRDEYEDEIEALREQNREFELQSDALYQRVVNCRLVLDDLEECKLSQKARALVEDARNALDNY